MKFDELKFTLKDGRNAVLRSPTKDDAEIALEYFKKVTTETNYLLLSGSESANCTLENEQNVLQEKLDNPNAMMISCFVDGKFAGNCDISFETLIKTRHRCNVGIALLEEYWNLGIGTKMFQALEQVASSNENITQMELICIEGNERARHLYEKSGFRIAGIHPNAAKLPDGKFYNEYLMIKQIR